MHGITHLQHNLFDWLQQQPSGDQFEVLNDLDVSLFASQGDVRARNEDRVAYIEFNRQVVARSPLALAVLADGMGGHAGGDRAASTAIAALSSYIALGDSFGGLKSLLLKAALYANEQVFALLGGQGGTTLSAILYGKQGAIGINVGDSRIYMVGDNSVRRLTVDDTLAEQLRPPREGSANEGPKDDRLIQFVGMGRDLEPHVIDLVSYSSDQTIHYLLTSDGAHFLGDRNLSLLISRNITIPDVGKAIVEVSHLLGSADNASVVTCPKAVQLPNESASPSTSIKVITPGRCFMAVLETATEAREPQILQEIATQPPLFDPQEDRAPERRAPSRRSRRNVSRSKRSEQGKTKKSKKSTKQQAPSLELLPAGSRHEDRKK